MKSRTTKAPTTIAPEAPATAPTAKPPKAVKVKTPTPAPDPLAGVAIRAEALSYRADLHRARVYYTVLGEDREHRGTEAALRSARSHLRAELGHQIRMKFTPELQFEEDPGATSGERVDELLRQIHAQETTREGKPVTDEEAS